MPQIPSRDCVDAGISAGVLDTLQTMATVQYAPDGSLNSTFKTNYAELPGVLGAEQQRIQGILDRALAAGYPATNPITESMQALVSAWATAVTHAQANQSQTFFDDVVTAQTASDNLSYDLGSNCAFESPGAPS